MSDALDTKIREVVFTIVDAGPLPPSFREVEAVVDGVTRPAAQRARSWRSSRVAAIAAIAVVAIAALTWSLVRTEEGDRSVRSGPTTTVNGDVRLGSGWSKEAAFDGQVFAIATSGNRSVAVGYGIWASTDGRTWNRATVPGYGSGLDGSVVTDVVAHDGQFVAVGTGSDKQAAVWTSTDGSNWTRQRSKALEPRAPTVPEGMTMDRSSIASIASTAQGYVAVGRVLQGGYGPMVWASPDGRSWRQVGTPIELQRVGPADGGLVAVTARGSTVLVAGQRTIWRTKDLEQWQSVTLPSAYLSTLAVHDGAVLAAGISNEGGRHNTIWRSRDLRHWETAYAGAPSKVSNISALVSGKSSVLALGFAGDQEVSTPGLLLESHDGRSWAPADPPLPVSGAPTAATFDRASFLLVTDETRLLPSNVYMPAIGIYRSR